MSNFALNKQKSSPTTPKRKKESGLADVISITVKTDHKTGKSRRTGIAGRITPKKNNPAPAASSKRSRTTGRGEQLGKRVKGQKSLFWLKNIRKEYHLNDNLEDKAPDPKDVARARVLNSRFKELESALGVKYRAFCGGKYGIQVKRYDVNCTTQPGGENEGNLKPVATGMKALKKSFFKNHGITFENFESYDVGRIKQIVIVHRNKNSKASADKKSAKSIKKTPVPVKKQADPIKKEPIKEISKPKQETAPKTPAPKPTPKPTPTPAKSTDDFDAKMDKFMALLEASRKNKAA